MIMVKIAVMIIIINDGHSRKNNNKNIDKKISDKIKVKNNNKGKVNNIEGGCKKNNSIIIPI